MNKNNVLIILAHQDDELFILPSLIKIISQKNLISCVYLTTAPIGLSTIREQESLKVLNSIGLPSERLYFLGKQLNIIDGNLPKDILKAFIALRDKMKDFSEISEIYCPLWEGGHQDHDACCFIAQTLRQSYFPKAAIYGFPLYQGEDLFGKFFWTNRVPRQFQALTFKNTHSFSIGWKVILNMFRYHSQWKTFIGLGPQIFWHMFVRRVHQLVDLRNSSVIMHRPHKGPLLYERYRRTTFEVVMKSLSELSTFTQN